MSASVKRVIRTVFQTGLALAAGLPLIIQASGASQKSGGVVLALAVAAGVTRIMALPAVERLLALVGLGFVVDPAPVDSTGTPVSTDDSTVG